MSCWLGVKKLNKRAPATPGELARLWISETLKIQVCVYIFFLQGKNCQDPPPIPANDWPMCYLRAVFDVPLDQKNVETKAMGASGKIEYSAPKISHVCKKGIRYL